VLGALALDVIHFRRYLPGKVERFFPLLVAMFVLRSTPARSPGTRPSERETERFA
jgi:hypothetical protein